MKDAGRNTRIAVKPLSGACGAEIEGVDLRREMDDETFTQVRQALHEHLVIFLRDQHPSPDQLVAFGRRFGELRLSDQYLPLEGHPEIIEIVKEPDATGIVGNLWHSDESFMARPALGSILHIIESPDVGGDTLFANQVLAYETLSPGMQRMLSSMRVVFSDASLQQRNKGRSLKVHPDAHRRAACEAVHPAVRTHPATGRKALYVHRPYAVRFEGWTEAESRPLFDHLFAHAARPEFTCRFRWREGSVAFWDNRSAQHYALNDFSGQRRYGHRVTVVGEVPQQAGQRCEELAAVILRVEHRLPRRQDRVEMRHGIVDVAALIPLKRIGELILVEVDDAGQIPQLAGQNCHHLGQIQIVGDEQQIPRPTLDDHLRERQGRRAHAPLPLAWGQAMDCDLVARMLPQARQEEPMGERRIGLEGENAKALAHG